MILLLLLHGQHGGDWTFQLSRERRLVVSSTAITVNDLPPRYAESTRSQRANALIKQCLSRINIKTVLFGTITNSALLGPPLRRVDSRNGKVYLFESVRSVNPPRTYIVWPGDALVYALYTSGRIFADETYWIQSRRPPVTKNTF